MRFTLMPKRLSAATLIVSLLLAFLSPAAALANSDGKKAAAEERPPILAAIEKQGIKILGEMDLPGGLRAFAAKAGTQPLTIYVTPDNNHVIVGTLVDENGQDLAADQLKELMETPIHEGAWQTLERSTWVQDGNPDAPRIVYTFTDPNCPYCNRFWHAARPWVEAGKVQLRHVMVGVIRQDSPAKAAAILEATSPEEALTENETRHAEGGIAPLSSISAATTANLEANANLMAELGFGGTPAIVYRKSDGAIATMSGLPQEGALQDVLGPQ